MDLSIKCLQLDLARQKENLPFIKSYFDFAVQCGYNSILLYLENAVRTKSFDFFDEGESYSENEIKEIVAYAESLGLDVIPALENLGHLEKFFNYPQFSSFSEINDSRIEGRGFESYLKGSVACTSNEEFYAVFDEYIKQVVTLFNSRYIHIGLDEPFDFALCKKCKLRIKNGESKVEIFKKHVIHSYNLIKSLGKQMMMWDDFFEYANIVEDLPRDIIFCNWNYGYVEDEPNGHWVDKIQNDWFGLYDKLGFKYLFCVYAHRTSSTYNVDSFTEYANKYHPIGAVTTAWCRADSFYFCSYPFIKYCGYLWNNKIDGLESKINIFKTTANCSKETARRLALQNTISYGGNPRKIGYSENDTLLKKISRENLLDTVLMIEKELGNLEENGNEVLKDIYFNLLETYNDYYLSKQVDTYLEDKLRNRNIEKYIEEINKVKKDYQNAYKFYSNLWLKYRKGIKSTNCNFENKYKNRIDELNNMINGINEKKEFGLLYFQFMMHELYNTSKVEISVKYVDRMDEETVYTGSVKPSVADYNVAGIFTCKFTVRNEKIEYVILSSFGEGVIFPINVRYVENGNKRLPLNAVKIYGNVENVENILKQNCQFATLGIGDGIKHFNDIELSKQKHTIKIFFNNKGVKL